MQSTIAEESSKKGSTSKEGGYYGAKTAVHPDWFKDSFLDLEEDISDAAGKNKRLVVYFWQPGCPYCTQLWEDNFSKQDIVDKFRNNFEIVALNMWGDREIVSVAGNDYTEKSFSEALGIKYTPTLLFFDENKKVVHQLNGYIPPEDFKRSLDFVSGKHELSSTFGEFSAKQMEQLGQGQGEMIGEDFFSNDKVNLKLNKNDKERYLAVFFEAPNCKNCELLHSKTLQNKMTRELAKQFKSVQLNRFSDAEIVTPTGEKTSVVDWANKLGISYLPAMVFFDQQGNEAMRIDAQMRTFHIESVFDYVLSDAYKTDNNFQRWISARSEKIRKSGVDVDIWAY